jgi:hypothetical protein
MSGIPVTLRAIPLPGSKFVEWRGISSSDQIEIDPADTHEIVAVFDTTSATTRQPIVINEIMYHPLNSLNSEWVELYNPNNFSISLEGYEFTDGGVDNHFFLPSTAIIGPLDFYMLAGDLANYQSEFISSTDLSGSFNSGGSGFNLNNNGETIYLKNASGDLDDYVQYDNVAPWHEPADGGGPSLQLVSPDLDNNIPSHWFVSNASLYSPGKQNDINTGAEEIAVIKQTLKAYPNPVGETLYLEVPDTFGPEIHVRLFSLTGTVVAHTVFHTAGLHGVIPWNHGLRERGAYLLQVNNQTQLLIFSGLGH